MTLSLPSPRPWLIVTSLRGPAQSMLDAMIPDAPLSLTPERLRAANIHPETRLATDYLNHFNEVVMLLELVPTMPDCIEDVLAWAPATYEQHFIRSHYRDKDLVLEAFAHAPVGVRRRFLAVWDDVARLGFDERFKRTWEYYLAYCEGGFRAGSIDVCQIRIEKPKPA